LNGELAQSIALVAHGNAYLSGSDEPPSLEETNSAFKYTRSLEFRGDETFHGTAGWFRWLRDQGIERLSLVVPQSHAMFAAFADGQPSAIATGRNDWVGQHTVVDTEAVDNRIWGIVYSARDPIDPEEPVPLETAADRLRDVLLEASAFANAHDQLIGFGDLLRDAAKLLDSTDPRAPYHDDMLPARGYDLRSRQGVAAATCAWVFGGMGSWNDAGFDRGPLRDEYDELTSRFFAAVNGALVSATNSFDPAAVPA
jgi:hypothetical protein